MAPLFVCLGESDLKRSDKLSKSCIACFADFHAAVNAGQKDVMTTHAHRIISSFTGKAIRADQGKLTGAGDAGKLAGDAGRELIDCGHAE